jgi:hypothetical protein
MRYFGAALALTLVSAIELAACSSRVTSLESEKTFSSLSADERRKFCEDQFQYTSGRVDKEDLKRIKCADAARAVVSGDGAVTERERPACQKVYEACMSVPAQEAQSSCETFAADAEGCAATVGDASKCAEAKADELEELASRADAACRELGRPQASAQKKAKVVEASKTQACTRVQQLCPKLFGEQPTSSTFRR